MNRLKQEILAAAVSLPRQTGPGAFVRDYIFQEDFVGFQGHFPGYSILPAIVQILLGVSLAEEIAESPLKLASVENARFLVQIRPGDKVQVALGEKQVRGRCLTEVRLSVEEKPASSLLLCFSAQETS